MTQFCPIIFYFLSDLEIIPVQQKFQVRTFMETFCSFMSYNVTTTLTLIKKVNFKQAKDARYVLVYLLHVGLHRSLKDVTETVIRLINSLDGEMSRIGLVRTEVRRTTIVTLGTGVASCWLNRRYNEVN